MLCPRDDGTDAGMPGDLRADIGRAFESARQDVTAEPADPAALARTVPRWIEGVSRFLADDPDIAEGLRLVTEALDAFVAYLARETPDPRSLETFRRHLVSELHALERLVLERGRANERAERVGLGLAGQGV